MSTEPYVLPTRRPVAEHTEMIQASCRAISDVEVLQRLSERYKPYYEKRKPTLNNNNTRPEIRLFCNAYDKN